MMRVVPWEHLAGLVAYRETPCALSVGVFDGVHLGHRTIIRGITAADRGLLPVVVTFTRPPQNVLDPDPARKILLAPERKLAILGSLGVAVAVVIDFSPEFSKMTATSFFEALSGAFRVNRMVEGENFHFGRDRAAGRQALAGFCHRIGASLHTAETVMFKGLPVSSTRIRHAVRAGMMEDVRTMLAGPYPLDLPADGRDAGADGTLVIEKHHLAQILPDKGTFRCGTDGGGAADVVIDKERIFIRMDRPSIETLYFEEKTTPESRGRA